MTLDYFRRLAMHPRPGSVIVIHDLCRYWKDILEFNKLVSHARHLQATVIIKEPFINDIPAQIRSCVDRVYVYDSINRKRFSRAYRDVDLDIPRQPFCYNVFQHEIRILDPTEYRHPNPPASNPEIRRHPFRLLKGVDD